MAGKMKCSSSVHIITHTAHFKRHFSYFHSEQSDSIFLKYINFVERGKLCNYYKKVTELDPLWELSFVTLS